MIRRAGAGAALAAFVVLAGCGKKGPPLAPLHLAPARVENVKATRRGSEVELRFTVPSTNANAPGPVDLDRVEVYAMTVAPGAPTPPNRELTMKRHLAGTIPVEPLPEEGAPPPTTADDARPAPGETAVFVETLTEEKLTPVPPTTPMVLPEQTGAEPLPFLRPTEQHPTRVYVLRGATRSGRPGVPSAQLAVPLSPVPPPPGDVEAAFTEAAVTLDWEAPPPPEDPAAAAFPEWMFLAPQFPYLFYKGPPPATTFNVYRRGGSVPLNAAPVAETTFVRPGVEYGVEQCYVVRTVRTTASVAVESAGSEPACVTPVDKFAPAAPKALQAVAAPGGINLNWDANTEPDLAGYIVLRGEGPDATLQALMTAPITGTRYLDTAVTSGVRYVYAVVAVDRATPPNMSPQSTRAEETAR